MQRIIFTTIKPFFSIRREARKKTAGNGKSTMTESKNKERNSSSIFPELNANVDGRETKLEGARSWEGRNTPMEKRLANIDVDDSSDKEYT